MNWGVGNIYLVLILMASIMIYQVIYEQECSYLERLVLVWIYNAVCKSKWTYKKLHTREKFMQ